MEPDITFRRRRAVTLLHRADRAATFEERTRRREEAEHFAMLARETRACNYNRKPSGLVGLAASTAHAVRLISSG